jgi:hypothetical protein
MTTRVLSLLSRRPLALSICRIDREGDTNSHSREEEIWLRKLSAISLKSLLAPGGANLLFDINHT